jgi:hypothetical protein
MIATDPLAPFCAALLDDPAAVRRLGGEIDPARFAALAGDWARRRDVALAELTPARPNPPVLLDGPAPPGWLPSATGPAGVDWLYFPWRPRRPFFEDDVAAAAALPLNRLVRLRTPLAAMAVPNPQPPAGLVFHLSRCGSTLVAQMLGAPDGHLAIAESPAIDAALSLPGLDEPARVALLRGLAHGYGRGAERLFLKLDSWHTRQLPLFRRAFPDTRWIFLHREPVEILVSHLRRRGMHTVAGLVPPERLGLDASAATLPAEAHIAAVLEAICAGVLAHWDPQTGLLVDYRDLPGAVAEQILPHFGLALADTALAAMAAAAGHDAKAPGHSFTADGAAKQREASPAARAAAESLQPLMAALARLSRSSSSPR